MDIKDKLTNKLSTVKSTVVSKAQDFEIETVLIQAMRVPGVKIDREIYLRKELKTKFPEDVVETAIKFNPAYAGIATTDIDTFSTRAINYEASKVTAISFAAGLPGGIAGVAATTVDVTQYFAFVLRIMQKLAYLYGFEEFELKEDNIDDDTLNQLLILLGVMMGVQQANTAIKFVADAVATRIARTLPRKALTKGAVYPLVKKIAQQIGVRMTKQVFADGISKVVPVLGGVASGAVTYASFKPSSLKLKKKFLELPTSDPSFYEKERALDQDPSSDND